MHSLTRLPSLPQGKYGKRKSRFKRSDGSTSSDTTSNSFVRQVQAVGRGLTSFGMPFLSSSGMEPQGYLCERFSPGDLTCFLSLIWQQVVMAGCWNTAAAGKGVSSPPAVHPQ